jgi:prepilin-type N-terminal cleavage/methylation domain-containing protein
MRNSKGFTLVELAVVLVIIGIIIGAVIKGQDLITNAQAKQVSSAVSSWRNLAFAYLDRNGRLPGDGSRNGIIGDALPAAPTPAETAADGTSIHQIVATMSTAPANPVTVGSMSFWVYFGNVAAASGTRNAIIICKDAACGTAFSADELEIIKSMDAGFDGVADAGLGQLRAATAVTPSAALTAANNRENRLVTAATLANNTTNGAATDWATTHLAAVWLFDRSF